MDANKQLIERFYKSFQNLDWRGMQECYHNEVFFYDPVFEDLDATRAKAMWKMLCLQAKDFSLEFNKVEADDEYGSCHWKATYTFSKTGRKVVNRIKAHFKFHEGKIIEHMDDFDLYKWSRQALGTGGWIMGWSSFLKNKIRNTAKLNLEKFMSQDSVLQNPTIEKLK
jgi:ketosteroid isomerase-like protein